jgi:Chromo (CHRromatin Organisation MOdifier) domain
LIKRRNEGIAQVLIKWTNLTEEESTWEDTEFIHHWFPHFSLRDEVASKDRGMSQAELNLVGVDKIQNKRVN